MYYRTGSSAPLQMRQELEKIRRRLEAELSEAREQLAEKTSQLDQLQTMMNRREEELQQALNRSATSFIHSHISLKTKVQSQFGRLFFPFVVDKCHTTVM